MQKSLGFTLIELLVVVLIIGILAAVAVPQYQKAVEKAKFVKGFPLFRILRDNQELFHLSNGDYARSLEQLDISLPSGCKICDAYGTESLCCGDDLLYQFNHGWRGVLVMNYCPGKAQSADSGQCYYTGSIATPKVYYSHAKDYFAPLAGRVECGSHSKPHLCKEFCRQFNCN